MSTDSPKNTTESMTTKYGKVTITLKETAWKNDLKTITVVVQDADEEIQQVIGMTRKVKASKSDDLSQKRNQARFRVREAIEEALKDSFQQPTLLEFFLSRIGPENDLHMLYSLCSPNWRQDTTKDSNLTYFRRHALEPISKAIEENSYGPDTVKQVAADILADVQANQCKRHRHAEASQDETQISTDTSAKQKAIELANQHIRDCNTLFASLRDEMLYPDTIPFIYIPPFVGNEKSMYHEQCKALPPKTLIITAALLRLSLHDNPLSMGGIIMMTALLRTAEAVCPKYKEILMMGNYAVYGVVWQGNGTVRIADLKTDNSYRLVVLPYFAVHCLQARRKMLHQQGYDDREIDKMYVVCSPNDPYRPANPNRLSAYLRKILALSGCSEEFWDATQDLMTLEPDPVPAYAKYPELSAYVFRRSGCSYLCNCTGTSPVLVDIIMGHMLSRKDADQRDYMKNEDNWQKVADRMECIVYDPRYSANPAFLPCESSIPGALHKRVKIEITEEMIRDGKVTLSVQTARTDDVYLTIPQGVKEDCTMVADPAPQSPYPYINEFLDQAFFDQNIAAAETIYNQNKEVLFHGSKQ